MSKLHSSEDTLIQSPATARLVRAAVQAIEALEGRQLMSATPGTLVDTAHASPTTNLEVSLQHSAVLGESAEGTELTADQRRAERQAEREAEQAARLQAKETAKAEREALRAQKKAERLARRAERLAERAERRAERQGVDDTPVSTPTSEAVAPTPVVETPVVAAPAGEAPAPQTLAPATPVAAPVNGPAAAPAQSGRADNDAPSVKLLSLGFTKIAGTAHMPLRADASDSDGRVTRVDFYANGEFIGTAGGAPWMVAWVDVEPGTYDVTAHAFDNDGAVTISDAMSMTVVNHTGGETIRVKNGQSISDAVRRAQAGDTVLIAPGTYHDTITLRNSGTSDKPITIKADGPAGSVIIDGDGASRLVADQWVGTGYWTTIQGITFRDAGNEPGQDNAAIKTTNGMRLIDVTVEEVDGAGIGVFGENVALIRTTAQYNGCTGIGGSRITNGLLYDCVSHGNNTEEYSGSYEGGGGKFTRVRSLLVQNHTSFDNNGPGIWFDGDNINVTIRGGEFHDNHDLWRGDGTQKIGGRGIQLEISGVKSNGNGGIDEEGPILIEDVLTYDNDNASVQVYATANVTIQNSRFINDYIDLKDKRPAPYMVRNLTIKNNTLEDAHIEADKALVTDFRDEDIIINNNTYKGDGKVFRWDYKDLKLSAVRDLGFEKDGEIVAA